MKYKLIVLLTMMFLINSCKKEDVSKSTRLLTSKTWGQPTVIHSPADIGYWTVTTCPAGSAIDFNSNGNYIYKNFCQNINIDGKWNWSITDKEIKLETFFNGIKQKTYILTIVELSDSLLHTKEREISELPENYFELKYRPKAE